MGYDQGDKNTSGSLDTISVYFVLLFFSLSNTLYMAFPSVYIPSHRIHQASEPACFLCSLLYMSLQFTCSNAIFFLSITP